MAPKIHFTCTWCENCQDWELFNSKNVCKNCGNEFVPFYLSKIPKEKIEEQKQRYIQKEGSYLMNVFGTITSGFKFESMDNYTEIEEFDAGYIKEKEQRKERIDKAMELWKQLEEEAKQYKHLSRNDNCICGSGKKFKKCECYQKYQSYL
jgi:hypothetical protein